MFANFSFFSTLVIILIVVLFSHFAYYGNMSVGYLLLAAFKRSKARLIIVIPGIQKWCESTCVLCHGCPQSRRDFARQRFGESQRRGVFSGSRPQKSIIQVENFLAATVSLHRPLCAPAGQHELDEMLAEREKTQHGHSEGAGYQTDAWGIKVPTSRSNVDMMNPC